MSLYTERERNAKPMYIYQEENNLSKIIYKKKFFT